MFLVETQEGYNTMITVPLVYQLIDILPVTVTTTIFNGKELQEAINLYDYGARFYDPVIGRFGTIDKFAEKYYNLSSYQYAALNPISNIDINGDSIYIVNGKEKILYHEGKLY